MARTAVSNRQRIRNFGSCLRFIGGTDFVDFGNPSAITGTGASSFTVISWIRTTALKGVRKEIFAWGAGGGATQNSGYLYLGTTNKLQFDLAGQAGPAGAKVLTDGQWHMVAVTNSGGTVQLYTDGSTDGSTASMTPNITSGSVRSARSLPGDSQSDPYAGLIDEPRFYTRALSATEIQNLYLGTEPATTNLQLWSKFDEGTGTTVADSSGNSVTGTLTNSPTFANNDNQVPFRERFRLRNFGTSLNFSDGASFVDTGYAPSITTASSFTISLWAKAVKADPATQVTLLGAFKADLTEFVLHYTAGNPRFYLFPSGGVATYINSSTWNDIRDNKWHHWCLVKSGNSAILYIDAIRTGSASGMSGTANFSGRNLYIGARNSSSPDQFIKGKIDEIAWIDAALTLSQVEDIYYRGNYTTDTKSLWYLFDEGSGSSTTDASGNARTGTITGATYSTDVAMAPRVAASARVAA